MFKLYIERVFVVVAFLGTHVYRHCTEFTSTTCVPCTDATYTEEPNGLPNCLNCKMCDSGKSAFNMYISYRHGYW